MKTLIQIWKIALMITLMVTSVTIFAQTQKETVFTEDFESGQGSWSANNGVWDVGIPKVGPPSTHSDSNCAGTILDGNYPNNANTILISPSITLPSLSDEETIQMKFWQWFSIENGDDQGVVQISVDYGSWETISSVQIDGGNPTWSQYVADLSSYAGSPIRVGFYFTSDNYTTQSGWYIDDISIETEVVIFPNPEDFESGVGNWSADNGLWEVGEPPFDAHSGANCIGTVLDGDYTNYANTRLISPLITLPSLSDEEIIQMKFWQRFSIENGDDQGDVQISVDYGSWETISSVQIDGGNPTWSQYVADLSSYAGSPIRVGFYFTSDNYTTQSGWYIDDISIETEVVIFPNPEDFESGVGNWSADNGLWEVGEPPFDAHSGANCIGTVLDGDYTNYANTRLISPEVILTPIFEESPNLYFYQRFYIEYNDDKGFVQVSVDGGDWQTISGPFSGTNDTWSQHAVNLADFADSIIRIAFYFTSDNYTTQSGWYIDDIRIEGIITGVDEYESQNLTSNNNKLSQNHPNPFTHQTKIQYNILNDENVQLSIYNINGELIRIIVNERQKRGEYSVIWQGKNEHNNSVSPGIYFYELKTVKNLIRKKMLLLE